MGAGDRLTEITPLGEKPDVEKAEGSDLMFSLSRIVLPRTAALWKHSRHVPLVPVICIFAVLFLVTVIVTVTVIVRLSIRAAPEPCPECKSCGYSAPCEEDWIWHRGKCYFFSETYDEWINSQNFCASHNASLSLIDTQEELDFLRRHKDIADHWIGLYRDPEAPVWVWANGSKFRNTFPVTGDSPCVYLSDAHVSSTACHGEKKWICNKIDANSHMTHF